jgi:hypothetical protein
VVIERLPITATPVRTAPPANDNVPPGERVGPPLVRALRRRPGMTYATAGNVILPLAFAERMPGWRARAAPRR